MQSATSPHLSAIVAATPARPLSPREMVSDNMLRALAVTDPAREVGELSVQDQHILAMYLPDICGELIARRAVMRADAGKAPLPASRNHAEEIQQARSGIYATPVSGVPL